MGHFFWGGGGGVFFGGQKDMMGIFSSSSPEFQTDWDSWRAPSSPARPRTGSSQTPAPASEAGSAKMPSGSVWVSEKATRIRESWDLQKEHLESWIFVHTFPTITSYWTAKFWWYQMMSSEVLMGSVLMAFIWKRGNYGFAALRWNARHVAGSAAAAKQPELKSNPFISHQQPQD